MMQNNYYPMYQPTQAPQRLPNQQVLKGRPVTSLDEVRATTIDFDGSLFFFPDIANRRIYTKQINLDGTASLNVYELKNIPIDANSGNFITREEFEMAIQQLREGLLQQPVQQQQSANIASQF